MPVTTHPRTRRAAAEPDALDSPAEAQRALEQAAAVRAQGAAARQDGAAMVAQARAALAAAEQRARLLGWIAEDTEQFAVEFETRARVIGVVRGFRERLPAAQAALDALESEYASLAERIAALQTRLADLDADRAGTQARLTEARSAGKVAQVAELRTELTALDEVAADLRGQLQAARARQYEIGEPGAERLLDHARREAEDLRRQYAQGIDALGPDAHNETVQPMVCRLLDRGKQCEGEAEQARHAAILAILDGEPGWAAIMRGAREENEAKERYHRGERAA